MNKIKLLFLLFSFLGTSVAQFTVEHYTKKDGLLDNNITNIAQSEEGYVWMLNAGSICRFNGTDFKYYAHKYDLTNWLEEWGGVIFKYKNHHLYIAINSELGKFDGLDFSTFPKPADDLFNYHNEETGEVLGKKDPNQLDKFNQHVANGILYSDKGSYRLDISKDVPGYQLRFNLINDQYSFYNSENNYIYILEEDSLIQIPLSQELKTHLLESSVEPEYAEHHINFMNKYFYKDLIIFIDKESSDLTIFNSKELSYSTVQVGKKLTAEQNFKYSDKTDENGYHLVRKANEEVTSYNVTANVISLSKKTLANGEIIIPLANNTFFVYTKDVGASFVDDSAQTIEKIESIPLNLKINNWVIDEGDNIFLGTDLGLFKLSPCQTFIKNWKEYIRETTDDNKTKRYNQIIDEFSNTFIEIRNYSANDETYEQTDLIIHHHDSIKPKIYKKAIDLIVIIDPLVAPIENYSLFDKVKRWAYYLNDTIYLTDNEGSFKGFSLPPMLLINPTGSESYSISRVFDKVFYIVNDKYYLLSDNYWYKANFETFNFEGISKKKLPKELTNKPKRKFLFGASRDYIYSLDTTIQDTLWVNNLYDQGAFNVYWAREYMDTLNRHWFMNEKEVLILDDNLNILLHDSTLLLRGKSVMPNNGLIDEKGNFWIPSDIGINVINPNTNIDSLNSILIDRSSGLPGYYIYKLLDDGKGHLWILLPTGVYWLDLNKLYSTKEIKITELTKNGFPDYKYIGCYLDHDSNMVFYTEGIENAVTLGSDYFFTNNYSPSIFFREIIINDSLVSEQLQMGKTVDISSTKNTFTYLENNVIIHFQGIDYRAPKNLVYQYKLDGLKNDWTTTTATNVKFDNLNPGKYSFQIKCCLDNQCSETISYNFTIASPFWETWWFLALMILGFTLIILLLFKWRTSKLTQRQKELESEVEEATGDLRLKHEELEETHKEITDSIAYAKRIQSAILPPAKLVKEYLQESFILYKPKDIVAGDFYWLEHKNGKVLFAAADCTGHGVPGAMVSVVCNNALNRSVREYGLSSPGGILDKTREIVIQEFDKSEEDVKDGMDIALCSLKGNKLQYAGAHNPLWIIRKGEILETKANKQPIGKFDKPSPYTTHTFELEKGDSIYIFSDGYVDQFGGEKGKKFKSKAFRTLLLSIQDKAMEEQRVLIDEAFEAWRGNLEQIDDVCVIGVRI